MMLLERAAVLAVLAGAISGLFPASAPRAADPQNAEATHVVASDRPATTNKGHRFTLPAGWVEEVRGTLIVLTPPEGGSLIALMDRVASEGTPDPDAVVAEAWSTLGSGGQWPLRLATDRGGRNGWDQIRSYEYDVPAAAQRYVGAQVWTAGQTLVVALVDFDLAVAERRGSQVALVLRGLQATGHQTESFVGRTPLPFDQTRLDQLRALLVRGQRELDVPGIAVGIVQDGRVVMAEGFGVRDADAPGLIDAHTRFPIASSTKPLTTLLLAKLVDSERFGWDSRVTDLLGGFRLGDPQATERMQVRHLLCACTGLPRSDMAFILDGESATPESVVTSLANQTPTSDFGALFQYSNLLAATAGYIAGHVVFPELAYGEAYDRVMHESVLSPLAMRESTFDVVVARAGNHAEPHGTDLDGKTRRAAGTLNDVLGPVRPAGGLWSTAPDMLRYVQMELDRGVLPDGSRYIGEAALQERYRPMVAVRENMAYGLGLFVEQVGGVEVVSHGGDALGFHSDLFWLPEARVGAVFLTNSDSGRWLRTAFRRRVIELLYDGNPEAEQMLTTQVSAYRASVRADRQRLTVPATPEATAMLAMSYWNAELGEVKVLLENDRVHFDFGAWRSEMATRRNQDGTWSFVTVAPGVDGFEFVLGNAGSPRVLVLRDAQHQYVLSPRG